MTALALLDERRPKHYPSSPRAPLLAIARPQHENRLLKALPDDAQKRISPHLELVELALGAILHETDRPLNHVYFPISAITSMLYVTENGASAQTAMVGREGMLGVSLVMGCKTWPGRAMVQNAGCAYRLPAAVLTEEFEHTPAVAPTLLRYIQSLITQIAQTAVCNRHHSIEQQLCRWLLTTMDRLAGDDIYITQELISQMIGVRREGVTEAAGKLQRQGMISLGRGHITVVDRAALERHACECYGVVRCETERLMQGRPH